MTKTTTRLTAAVEAYFADLQRAWASGGVTGEPWAAGQPNYSWLDDQRNITLGLWSFRVGQSEF